MKMAELLDVKRTSYRNWEENTEPSLTIIKSIAQALEIPAWKLLEGIIDFTEGSKKEKSGPLEPDYLPLIRKQLSSAFFNLQEAMKTLPQPMGPSKDAAHDPAFRQSGKTKRTEKQ